MAQGDRGDTTRLASRRVFLDWSRPALPAAAAWLKKEKADEHGGFGDLLIAAREGGRTIYLRDVADIRRGYQDPPRNLMRYNGQRGIALGISTVQGGNVVTMGEAIRDRMAELQDRTPLGMELGVVSLQSDAVTTAVNSFMVNLLEAVLIVVVVWLIASRLALMARGAVQEADHTKIDRILGFGFGGAMGIVLVTIIFIVWGQISEDDLEEALEGSLSAEIVGAFVHAAEPLAPDSIEDCCDVVLDAIDAARD